MSDEENTRKLFLVKYGTCNVFTSYFCAAYSLEDAISLAKTHHGEDQLKSVELISDNLLVSFAKG